jgi:hypothetical protein
MATEAQQAVWEIVKTWDVDTFLMAQKMFAPLEEEED